MNIISHLVKKFSITAALNKWEHDAMDASIRKLAEALGMSPDDISWKWHSVGDNKPVSSSR